MADITLAEFNGSVWLVGGDSFFDDLLANTLPPDISIELVQCESQSDVHELWTQHCGVPNEGSMPWVINPQIVNRIRGRSPDYAVFFAQWSAFLDHDALAVVRAAASWAAENAAMPVRLAEYLDPAGPQAMADLSRLRAQLIEDKLVEAGVARERIGRLRRDIADVAGMPQESQRIDIVVRPTEPPPLFQLSISARPAARRGPARWRPPPAPRVRCSGRPAARPGRCCAPPPRPARRTDASALSARPRTRFCLRRRPRSASPRRSTLRSCRAPPPVCGLRASAPRAPGVSARGAQNPASVRAGERGEAAQPHLRPAAQRQQRHHPVARHLHRLPLATQPLGAGQRHLFAVRRRYRRSTPCRRRPSPCRASSSPPAATKVSASSSAGSSAGWPHSMPASPSWRVNSSKAKASIGSVFLPYGRRSRKRGAASPR